MESILQLGIAFIVAFQSLGAWLAAPMQFFTFLGSENFFLIILPILYWCVDADLGVRVGAILLFTGGLNEALKLAFRGPRPYWYSTLVKALASETSFGVPSGHSQTAAGVWGMLAARIKRPWVWAAAVLVILFIGLSRLYLAVHFVHDVLLGWLIGGLVLWAFLHWWEVLAAWLKQKTLAIQIGLAFGLSLLMVLASLLPFLTLQNWVVPAEWLANVAKAGVAELPNPVSISSALTYAGSLFGFLAGLAWLQSRGGFEAGGPLPKRVVRFLFGLFGVLVLYVGLKLIFPEGETLVSNLLRYCRYALVGLWVAAGAPSLFVRLKLAQKRD
jgi:membrane-associated phospholipid phosphatase